ncbi:MAG: hypothetical protein A2666_03785 [Parcubacteria group bacterium RIFCSPHIGHO2_01_FULL_47_10b]|nr:MAG: hypothetical protein A2666_03785 [Parcubacteria group bacterium RIFCSPHIGHO2_01_FULL_47_10b]
MITDANTISLLLTGIGLIVVMVWNGVQYVQMRRQLTIEHEDIKQNMFAEYTWRYQEIFLNLPINIMAKDFSLAKLKESERPHILKYLRVYFDLCSEEYFLHRKGHLDEDVWKEWCEGMRILFSRPAFRDGWKKLNFDMEYYKDFREFVERELMDGMKHS